MKSILVAVDGSKRSDMIVKFASQLARGFGAKILIVYISPTSTIPDEYKSLKGEELWKAEESENRVICERIVSDMGEILKKEDIEFESVCAMGHAASKILEIAETHQVDLIVLGVVGLHGLGTIRALGSVARRVIERSRIPLVLVP